jgi:hypothetical protein
VIKGQAGAPDADPHSIDGLSGATITSNGVTALASGWAIRLRPLPRGRPRREGDLMDKKTQRPLIDPLFNNNPIALQVLGICSALAVTTKMRPRSSWRGVTAWWSPSARTSRSA